MTHAITINVSDALYQQLYQAASLFQQPTETIILDSLRHTLPPIFEDIPAGYQNDVFPLLAMNDQELLQESRRIFPPEHWQNYESLLEQKKTGQLRADGEQALQALKREADVLTFRRSAVEAAWLSDCPAAWGTAKRMSAICLVGWHPPE